MHGLHFSSNYLSDPIQMAVLAQSQDAFSTLLSEVIPHTFRPSAWGEGGFRRVSLVIPCGFHPGTTVDGDALMVLVVGGRVWGGAGGRCSIILGGVNKRLAGIYQFSQHAQPCVPFLLIPPLPPQDNNKNDSINPQVMGTLCMPSKQIRPSVN